MERPPRKIDCILCSVVGRGLAQAVEHSAGKVWNLLPAWWIDPTWQDGFAVSDIFHYNQWSTTGPSKAVLCVVLCV